MAGVREPSRPLDSGYTPRWQMALLLVWSLVGLAAAWFAAGSARGWVVVALWVGLVLVMTGTLLALPFDVRVARSHWMMTSGVERLERRRLALSAIAVTGTALLLVASFSTAVNPPADSDGDGDATELMIGGDTVIALGEPGGGDVTGEAIQGLIDAVVTSILQASQLTDVMGQVADGIVPSYEAIIDAVGVGVDGLDLLARLLDDEEGTAGDVQVAITNYLEGTYPDIDFETHTDVANEIALAIKVAVSDLEEQTEPCANECPLLPPCPTCVPCQQPNSCPVRNG